MDGPLFVHPFIVEGLLGCLQFGQLGLELLRTFTYRFLCEHAFSLLLGDDIAVGLLGHMKSMYHLGFDPHNSLCPGLVCLILRWEI